MKALLSVAAVALVFSSCAGDHLPSSVRTVSFAPAARRIPVVLAPAQGGAFARMADERGTWAVNQLRSSLSRELAAGGRFTPAPTGSGDAQIAIDTLRHGLIEVSANNFAVTASGTITLAVGNESLGQREFSGTGGEIRPLPDFEDPANYEAALQSVFDKVAIEIVAGL